MRSRTYYVYILSSRFRTLYIGITNDLVRRVSEHRSRVPNTYTARYRIHSLVYYECFPTPRIAIAREKQLKKWRRERKVELILGANPEWKDLLDRAPTGRRSFSR
ncbi:MAG TPA: GIY-YIG nuclease family protein [Gemmatimonadales bacterium]|nr:GIY-YIG nuclease family protein [Gemmatimonadales bacterium]